MIPFQDKQANAQRCCSTISRDIGSTVMYINQFNLMKNASFDGYRHASTLSYMCTYPQTQLSAYAKIYAKAQTDRYIYKAFKHTHTDTETQPNK